MDKTEELRSILLRHAGVGRTAMPSSRLRLFRSDAATHPAPSFYEPVLCIAVQGSKRLLLGEKSIVYDSSQFLLVAVDLPVMACVIDATAAAPYLAITLRLDRLVIVDMLASLPRAQEAADEGPGLAIGPIDDDLLDPVTRLVRLIERPDDAAILAPLMEREILYRLLVSPAGGVLRQMVAQNSRLARVDRAIDWIKRHYNEPMRIDALAEIAGMSQASLHRHFRAVTAMSPLQYQKQMRLQEARRRLVAEPGGAGNIGFSVGYESQSQFSREYARLFGAPPARDAERLRGLAASEPDRILSLA